MTGVLLPCNWKTALDGFLEAYHVPGTHPQLFRFDKSNTHLATLKEIDNRPWSPTTAYERHAHYSSVGKKKSSAAPGSAKDPSMGRPRASPTSAGPSPSPGSTSTRTCAAWKTSAAGGPPRHSRQPTSRPG